MFFKFLKSFRIFNKNKIKYPLLDSKRRKKLTKIIGFKISNESLYVKALTHRSFLDLTSEQIKSNERLEFLGDSILSIITAEFLFKKFPNENEGFLTKIRSHLVDTSSLIKTASKMNLADIIYYDKRFLDLQSIGIKKITADTVEALIGATYLDKGLTKTRKFVQNWIIIPNLKSGAYKIDTNFKGQLLELTHEKQLGMPNYFIVKEEGPEHEKIFDAAVKIDNKIYGFGKGNNKKAAEQNAAEKAIETLNLID